MAVSVAIGSSFSSPFLEAITYALSELGTPELSLKEEQKLAIHAVYSGSDVFVWLPTGFGKSVCFQTLPFVFDHKLQLISAKCSDCSGPSCSLDGGPGPELEG